MKRPFAYLGFSCLLGLLVAFFTEKTVLIAVSAILIFIFIALSIKKIKNAPLKLSVVGIIIACVSSLLFANTSQYDKYIGTTAKVQLRMAEVTNLLDYGTCYNAKVIDFDGEKVNIPVNLYSTNEFRYEYGDIFHCTASFNSLSNTKGFSYENSLRADGFALSCKVIPNNSFYITQTEQKTLREQLLFFRDEVRDVINLHFADDIASVLIAMLLGDKIYISDSVYSDFVKCGVNHILVVSGMHLSILCSCFYLVLGKVKLPKRYIYLFVIPVIIFYICFTGMGKSVIRSACMLLLLICSDITGEENDPINSLGLATFLICFVNPYSAVDIGFLLSVSATGGIVFRTENIADKMQSFLPQKFYKFTYPLFTIVAVSVSAFLFTFPILLYINHQINPIAIICSSILAFPAMVFMIMGLVTVILASLKFIVDFLVVPIFITNIAGKFMLVFCNKFAVIGSKMWFFEDIESLILFVSLGLMFAFFILFRNKNKMLKITFIVACLFVTMATYMISLNKVNNQFAMIVADTGYSNMLMFVKGRDAYILSCKGCFYSKGKSVLEKYHINNVELLCVDENESNSNLLGIENNYKIKNYFNFDKSGTKKDILPNINIDYYFNGDVIEIYVDNNLIILDNKGIEDQLINCDLCILKNPNTKFNSGLILANIPDENIIYGKKFVRIESQIMEITFEDGINIRRVE